MPARRCAVTWAGSSSQRAGPSHVLPHYTRFRHLISMRIAISTGGGDAPGLNAVIRAAVLAAVHRGWECFGVKRGFGSLLGDADLIPLGPHEVRGITRLGGTILGTSSRGDPLKWRVQRPDGSWEERDRSQELRDSFHAHRLDALIAIGGEGTLGIVQIGRAHV